METAEKIGGDRVVPGEAVGIQASGYLLEMSPDWIVLRASENIHHLLGVSHVTLINEPLGRFVHSQALHDLRNLFSRLSGTTGIGRVYSVRLTDNHPLVDVAFQLTNGRVLLDAVPFHDGFGECFGTVGGLVAGLGSARGPALLDGGARRMRALTGYDRVTLAWNQQRAESNRSAFAHPADLSKKVPALVCDIDAPAISLFPQPSSDGAVAQSIIRSLSRVSLEELRRQTTRASMSVPFVANDVRGEFRCDSRTPRTPHFELHAAAELFAQLFAMKLELDRLKNG